MRPQRSSSRPSSSRSLRSRPRCNTDGSSPLGPAFRDYSRQSADGGSIVPPRSAPCKRERTAFVITVNNRLQGHELYLLCTQYPRTPTNSRYLSTPRYLLRCASTVHPIPQYSTWHSIVPYLEYRYARHGQILFLQQALRSRGTTAERRKIPTTLQNVEVSSKYSTAHPSHPTMLLRSTPTAQHCTVQYYGTTVSQRIVP